MTADPDDQLSRMTRGIVGALAERRPFVMIVGPSTALDLLPDLPWELLPSPTSPAELTTGRRLNSIGADVVFSPAPGLSGIGRRFGLITAGGTPHVPKGASLATRLAVWPWRRRFTRAWMMRSVDVMVGVSGAQQRALLGDSVADQPVIALHAEDAASVSAETWRETVAQLDRVIESVWTTTEAGRR
ncbi:hypothetical protein IWX78_000949 [Mycetocola sp. CAN_C7]|uniref:hypothetical protein n=1 Tax=Mycetocola sp. CAN_C7 TaxID=2787724 RepID=UPI0018C9731E